MKTYHNAQKCCEKSDFEAIHFVLCQARQRIEIRQTVYEPFDRDLSDFSQTFFKYVNYLDCHLSRVEFKVHLNKSSHWDRITLEARNN